jgi:hypothetical protein
MSRQQYRGVYESWGTGFATDMEKARFNRAFVYLKQAGSTAKAEITLLNRIPYQVRYDDIGLGPRFRRDYVLRPAQVWRNRERYLK